MAQQKSKKTAARIVRLKVGGWGKGTLLAAELHGKREDLSSQRRRVNDENPLLVGGLDLQDLYARHAGDARMDKRTKCPVLHVIYQWPKSLEINEPNQAIMLEVARAFSQELFGGEAVFAGRLDRDEKGQHVVDIFAAPIVTKTSAKGVQSRWIQTTTHLKALTEKHREEIVRRHPTIKDITSPRSQGIALQSEWINHLRGLGYEIEAKTEKNYSASDWVTPEEYGLREREKALEARQQGLDEREQALEAREVVVAEVQELLKGNETPPQTEYREQIETEEHGMPYFQAYPVNNGGKELAWWQKIAHIVKFWREELGFKPSNDADFTPR
jgi:hypothetical protein